MRKFGSILMFSILLVIVSGCGGTNRSITEEQAKSIVIEHHTNSIGEVEILSITHKNNKYRIEWENKENCEQGIDEINDENGDIEMVEASIC